MKNLLQRKKLINTLLSKQEWGMQDIKEKFYQANKCLQASQDSCKKNKEVLMKSNESLRQLILEGDLSLEQMYLTRQFINEKEKESAKIKVEQLKIERSLLQINTQLSQKMQYQKGLSKALEKTVGIVNFHAKKNQEKMSEEHWLQNYMDGSNG